jgi:hypothetical protein
MGRRPIISHMELRACARCDKLIDKAGRRVVVFNDMRSIIDIRKSLTAFAETFALRAITRVHQYTAYISTLYFFEILYLMIALLFLYGKTASIIAGAVLSLLLAYHIIQIYFKKPLHRKLQLYLMDLHAAFVIGYLFASAASGIDTGGLAVIVHIIRSLTLVLELPLIIVLTRRDVVEGFK